MKLSLLAAGRDPSKTFPSDPQMTKRHVTLRKPGRKAKPALCVTCGRLVIGYLPRPGVLEVPCCSVECARRARRMP